MRIVSIYFAKKPQSYGDRKVYFQQQSALLKLGIAGDPETVFWEEFWAQNDKWLENGDQLVLCGDWSHDVEDPNFLANFNDRNLVPAITSKYPNAPERYNLDFKSIDEIFVSLSLSVKAAGYLEHGASLGHHRPIWIDLDKKSAFGTRYPDLPSYQARRLKCTSPAVVKQYLQELHKYYKKHDVYSRIHHLFFNFKVPLTQQDVKEYEKLDTLRANGMKKAESKCRRLKMGACKWSPKYAEAHLKYKYLRLSMSRLKGKKISTKFLWRLSKNTAINAVPLSQKVSCKHIRSTKK